MRFPNTILSATLKPITKFTIALGVPLASVLLLFGVANLNSPDVPKDENIRNCGMMILTGVVSIYALFLPYSGGILLCICAVALGFVSHGFFDNPVAIVVLLFGVLSVIRSRLSRKTVKERE